MRTEPKVTIVIPTFNRSTMLRTALRSAVDQTLDELEIVVSDNGSTDDTAEVVGSFDDPRIVYDPLENNVGLHRNLTRSLYLGTAPYVQVLHDDDYLEPRNAEVKARFLDEHPTVGAVYAPVNIVDQRGAVVETDRTYGGRPPLGVETGAAWRRRVMNQFGINDFTATMIRRGAVVGDAFQAVDGNSTDLGFWLRLSLDADFGFVAETLSARRIHDASQSTTSGSEAIDPEGWYVVTLAYVSTMLRAKRRFLATYGHGVPDADELREIAEQHARRQLAKTVDRDGWGDRRFRPTVTSLGRAARLQPRVLTDRRAAKAVLRAAAGQRGRALARRVRGRD